MCRACPIPRVISVLSKEEKGSIRGSWEIRQHLDYGVTAQSLFVATITKLIISIKLLARMGHSC